MEVQRLQSELESTRADISELQSVIQRMQEELDTKEVVEANVKALEAQIQRANTEMRALPPAASADAARRTLDKVRRLRAELERHRQGSSTTDARLAELEGKVDRISISKGIVQARATSLCSCDRSHFCRFPVGS